MKFSRRETILAFITVVVALLCGVFMLVNSRISEWKALLMEQDEVDSQIRQYENLLNKKDFWSEQFDALKVLLPKYPVDKKMDIHWLSVMDNLAAKHGVNISKRQVGEEKRLGDVYELPVECKAWEGSLDAIVHFLFDLQKEGAMLDIRQLLVKPKERGLLRGRFSLYCAYSRENKKQKI